MNIVIFGATGGTGQEIVKQALEQGHTVTAFVRNPAKLEHKHTNLKIIQGDVLDYTSDVADFMLKQLTSNTYLHKTPGLSY